MTECVKFAVRIFASEVNKRKKIDECRVIATTTFAVMKTLV